MTSYANRLALARRHVKQGRAVVERQRQLVSEQRAAGHDTVMFEETLRSFERSQTIFEDDLAGIES